MPWNLVTFTYGSSLFNKYQDFICNTIKESGVNPIRYNAEDLKKTEVYKENQEYFTVEKKYGWCAWKPLLILEAMKDLEEGDKIVLCDVEDV